VKRWERWTFNVASLVVVATGFAYFGMKYLMESSDPFAVVNHPWQASMLVLHLLASPPLILIFGIILNSHIMKKLRATKTPNRTSGLLSLGTFAAMVCSGYLLQVTMDERWLEGLVVVHLASGVVFTGAYGLHLVVSAGLMRRRPTASPVREVA
jgi:hypothetical protein